MKSLIRKLFAKKPQARKTAAPRKLGVESLDQRIVPASVGLSNVNGIGVLNISASQGQAEDLRVYRFTCPTLGPRVAILDNTTGTKCCEYSAASVQRVHFFGGAQADKFINDTDLGATIRGGGGNDQLYGGSAADFIFGGEGADKIYGGNGQNALYGEGGNDELNGGANFDQLQGGAGDDRLTGGAGRDWVEGNAGADTFIAPAGEDFEFMDSFDVHGEASSHAAAIQKVIDLTNQRRAEQGLPALQVNAALSQAASDYAQLMAQTNQFDHNLNGTSPYSRAKAAGYNSYYVGENIAMGYASAEAAMEGWMNSQGHRSNIVNANYKDIGVGIAQASNGQFYYVQMFGKL